MNAQAKISLGRFDGAIFSTFFSYSAGVQIIPITLVLMSEDLGFSLKDGGFAEGTALQIARWIPGLLSALLCGFIVAKYGKRKTLGVATGLISIGMTLCALAPSFKFITLSIMIAGAASGIIGALSASFIRSLHPTEPGRYINFLNSFWSIGTVFTVFIAGGLLLLGVSWRILLLTTGLLAVIPTVLLLMPESKGKEYPEFPIKVSAKEILSQMVSIIRDKKFMLFFSIMAIHAGGEGIFMFWSASYIQINFSASSWAAGIGAGLLAVGMVIGRTFAGYFLEQRHFKNAIIYFAIFGVAVSITFPLITELWVIFVVLFLSGIATAPIWPSLTSYCTERLGHLDNTMTMILLTISATPGGVIFMLIVGYIAVVKGGLTDAFYLVPLCFFIVATLIYIESRLKSKSISPDDNSYNLPKLS